MGERADELTPLDPRSAAVLNPQGVATGTPQSEDPTGEMSGDITWAADSQDELTSAEADGADGGEDGDIASVKAQIEQTRSDMSETIDAIQQKLSPSNIAQQAKETVRDATVGKAQDMVSNAGDTARGFGSTFVDTVKQNPVPAALAGLGLGWLLVSARKESSGSSYSNTGTTRYNVPYSTGEDYTRGPRYSFQSGADYRAGSENQSKLEQVRSSAGNIAGQAQNAAGQISDQASDLAGQAADSVQNAAGQVGYAAQHLGDQAHYQTQRAASGFQQMLQEQPLAVAAGAVAIGLAIGLSIPETQKENELLGETRDSVMDQARQTVQETAQKAQNVAQQAVSAAADTAKSEAHNQNLT